MVITIKIPTPKDLHALYIKAKTDAEKHDISWSGDINHGQGSGWGFEGEYTVNAEYITVTVLKKPIWATKARIEKEVKKYLSQEI
ncbi:MAG: hypothetical protein FWC89_06745 [Defluviitaleaceae bacterium]|nr:hypothetical protein [Defluviitaleaceae bacterium]